MSYYLLADTIMTCTEKELFAQKGNKYVAVLTTQEWAKDRDRFDMGIELDLDPGDIHNTKAEVNYDSLTGTFRIPDRDNIGSNDYRFAFALDEKGIVFIDDSGKVEQMIKAIRRTKRWRKPSLERFLYDFLEQIVENDLSVLERYEAELNRIEDVILGSLEPENLGRVNEIHNDIRKLLIHYEQIIDMTQELEENENGFFSEENLRYIHLFMNLLARRRDQDEGQGLHGGRLACGRPGLRAVLPHYHAGAGAVHEVPHGNARREGSRDRRHDRPWRGSGAGRGAHRGAYGPYRGAWKESRGGERKAAVDAAPWRT